MVNQAEDITLEELKQGSEQKLREVYEDNRDKFLNFAKRYNLPQDDVIDIYQDAYVAFYNNVMSGKVEIRLQYEYCKRSRGSYGKHQNRYRRVNT